MKTILVTGGAGFIGSNLIRFLVEKYNNYNIINFDSLTYAGNLFSLIDLENKNNYFFIKGDISKKTDLKKIKGKFDYVVNLGGYVDHTNKIKTFNSHFKGCKNLSNFFLNKGIKTFVQMGSSGEYGRLKSPHQETSLGNPQSVYSKAKFYATN